jgi:hypothetical protein
VTGGFTQLAEAIPWLAGLPAPLAARIDWAELIVPRGRIQAIRETAELATGVHVVTYRRGAAPAPGKLHLCQVLTPATLSPASLAFLASAERTLTGARIILCAYARPVRLRNVPATP